MASPIYFRLLPVISSGFLLKITEKAFVKVLEITSLGVYSVKCTLAFISLICQFISIFTGYSGEYIHIVVIPAKQWANFFAFNNNNNNNNNIGTFLQHICI